MLNLDYCCWHVKFSFEVLEAYILGILFFIQSARRLRLHIINASHL